MLRGDVLEMAELLVDSIIGILTEATECICFSLLRGRWAKQHLPRL